MDVHHCRDSIWLKHLSWFAEWLEDVYINHEKAIVPNINKQGRKLLSEGNALLETGVFTGEQSKVLEAAEKFKQLSNIAELYAAVWLGALGKVGICYKHMKKETKALSYIEIALECQDILAQKKDQHKELLYQSASCKEILEDYEGALKDYKRVLDNIGAFSSAVEGISWIDRKIGKSSNMLPTSNE